jgi:signal transduction histidine kinase
MPQQPRILVVDDEPRSLELLVRTLRRVGRIDTATTGDAAWASAQAEPLDLVISDQRMPGMKGVELLARIAERDPHAGRVLLTGYADINATIEAINAGRVHAYVNKPWSPDQMLLTAQSLLERVRLARENERLVKELLGKNASLEIALAELRAAQCRIVDGERLAAIGRLAAMIVHDLRGPLTVVRHAAHELSRDGGLPPEEQREVAAGALEEAERMTQMCNELLEGVRAGEDRGAREPEPLDAWVESVMTSVAEEVARQGIVLETRLGAPVEIPLDADRMRRALLNLVSNAVEAMPDGGRLLVETASDGERACIRVADSGCGVPDEIRDRLFEPFVTTGKRHGTGLGLAIVKKVVGDHGGDVEVSKGIAGGAVFELRLPLRAAPTAA